MGKTINKFNLIAFGFLFAMYLAGVYKPDVWFIGFMLFYIGFLSLLNLTVNNSFSHSNTGV